MITSNYRIFYIINVNNIKRLAYKKTILPSVLDIGNINICDKIHDLHIDADIPVNLNEISHIELATSCTAILMTNGRLFIHYPKHPYIEIIFPDDDVITKIQNFIGWIFIAIGQSNTMYKIHGYHVEIINIGNKIIDVDCAKGIYLTTDNNLCNKIINTTRDKIINRNTKFLIKNTTKHINASVDINGNINTNKNRCLFENNNRIEIISCICDSYGENYLILDNNNNLHIVIELQIYLVKQFWTPNESVTGIYNNDNGSITSIDDNNYFVVVASDNIIYYCRIIDNELVVEESIVDKYPAIYPGINIKSARSEKLNRGKISYA